MADSREIGLSGNTITEGGGAAIVEGLLHNKVLKRIRLKLNPIGFKYTSEIENLLELNNKARKKEFKPQLEHKIKELQTFEIRRDSVNEHLESKKDDLKMKRIELKDVLKAVEKEKNEELEETKSVENRLEDVFKECNKLEYEYNQMIKTFNEYRQNNKVAIENEYKSREKLDKEIQLLIRQIEEKKKEMGLQEDEDKKRIAELKIHIIQEKEAIENELIRLINYDKQYNEELNYEKGELGQQGSSKNDLNLEENNPTSLLDLNKETSVTSGAAKNDSKSNTGLNKKPSFAKPGSRTSISPPKRPKTGTATNIKPKNPVSSKNIIPKKTTIKK